MPGVPTMRGAPLIPHLRPRVSLRPLKHLSQRHHSKRRPPRLCRMTLAAGAATPPRRRPVSRRSRKMMTLVGGAARVLLLLPLTTLLLWPNQRPTQTTLSKSRLVEAMIYLRMYGNEQTVVRQRDGAYAARRTTLSCGLASTRRI